MYLQLFIIPCLSFAPQSVHNNSSGQVTQKSLLPQPGGEIQTSTHVPHPKLLNDIHMFVGKNRPVPNSLRLQTVDSHARDWLGDFDDWRYLCSTVGGLKLRHGLQIAAMDAPTAGKVLMVLNRNSAFKSQHLPPKCKAHCRHNDDFTYDIAYFAQI